jgi:hypothetical protein
MLFLPDVHIPLGLKVQIPEFVMSAEELVVNLEAPFKPIGSRATLKAGPTLENDFSQVFSIFPEGTIFGVANNHIGDFGIPGVEATLNSNIRTAGVWLKGGGQASTFRSRMSDYSVIFATEFDHSVPGPFESLGLSDARVEMEILSELSMGRKVIIFFHGGLEGIPIPAPSLKRRFRSWVDLGATAVFCHHTHVISFFEEYNGGIIDYGMGNFIVDPEKWRPFHETSLFSRGWKVTHDGLAPIYFNLSPGTHTFHVNNEVLKGASLNELLIWQQGVREISEDTVRSNLILEHIGRIYWRVLFSNNLILSALQSTIRSFLGEVIFSKLPKKLRKAYFEDLVGSTSNRELAMLGSPGGSRRDPEIEGVISNWHLIPRPWRRLL